MKFLKLFFLLFIFSLNSVFSQDSTEIYFQPETPGDYTSFKFSFVNKNQTSVKRVRLEMLTNGVSFTDAALSGQAQARGWYMLDSLYWIECIGDGTFYHNDTVGDFQFDLDGPDGMVKLRWTTYDSLDTPLKTDTSQLILLENDTCIGISRTASARENIKIPISPMITVEDFTMEIWFYLYSPITDNNTGYNSILLCIDPNGIPGSGAETYLGFGHSALAKNKLVYSYNGTTAASVSYSPPGGWAAGWHHAAVVRTKAGGIVELYTDGIRRDMITGINAGGSSSLSDMELGRWAGYDDYYFEGVLDDIRIWNEAKSAFDIVYNMKECFEKYDPVPSELVAFYPIVASEIFSAPSPMCVLHDFSQSSGLNSDVTCDIDWTAENAPLLCCGGDEECLCSTNGTANYNLSNSPVSITGWTPDLEDDCCWRAEISVDCDIKFINRMWFEIPSGPVLTGAQGPSAWTGPIADMPPGGISYDFPDGYLPAGTYEFDFCFEYPVDPSNFDVAVHLLDYFNGNTYNQPCDPLTFDIVCLAECLCDSVYISSIVEYNSGDPDHKCCYDLTVHSGCDKLNIDKLIFDYDQAISIGFANISGPQNWTKTINVFTNDDGYLAQGDHVFRLCMAADEPQSDAVIRLYYGNDQGWHECPPDTFEIVCDDTDSCDCEDIHISGTKFESGDPDHYCCYDATITTDCDVSGISEIDFIHDPAIALGFSNIDGPQNWSKTQSTFTNQDGYLMQGDHDFRICVHADTPADEVTVYVIYKDADGVKLCNDSIKFECDSAIGVIDDCCDKIKFNLEHKDARFLLSSSTTDTKVHCSVIFNPSGGEWIRFSENNYIFRT